MIIGKLGSRRRIQANVGDTPPFIMIVDDDDDIRSTLGELLEHMEFDVAAASDGLDALKMLRKGARPDVIFLDLMMPVMDGYEFLVELRSRAALAAIPIVIITAAGNARGEAAKLGAAGHLQKPFKLDELLATIERIRDGASTTSAE